jgi:hypothetical protein
MPRQPNPQCKSSISFKARSCFDEQKLVSLKKLAIQDEMELSDLFFEALDLLFVKHRLSIGGNPQLQLFQQPPLMVPKCKCGKDAVQEGYHVATKKKYLFCGKCFCEVPMRHDRAAWVFNSVTAERTKGAKQ